MPIPDEDRISNYTVSGLVPKRLACLVIYIEPISRDAEHLLSKI